FTGWKLSPAGRHVKVSDVPMKLLLAPDRAALLAVCGGMNPGLSVVDLKSRQTSQFIPLPRCFNGAAFSKDGKTLYVTGGNSNSLYLFSYEAGKVAPTKTISLTDHSAPAADRNEKPVEPFLTGIATHPQSGKLYLCAESANEIWVIDPAADHKVTATIHVGDYPHSCAIGSDPRYLFVSNWGDRTVSIVDTTKQQQAMRINVGVRPNDMALAPDGRLFVACSGD